MLGVPGPRVASRHRQTGMYTGSDGGDQAVLARRLGQSCCYTYSGQLQPRRQTLDRPAAACPAGRPACRMHSERQIHHQKRRGTRDKGVRRCLRIRHDILCRRRRRWGETVRTMTQEVAPDGGCSERDGGCSDKKTKIYIGSNIATTRCTRS